MVRESSGACTVFVCPALSHGTIAGRNIIMHIVQKILIAGLLVLTVYAFWPRDNDQVPAIEKWHLSVDAGGATRFMGLMLGESALIDAQLRFDEPGEVAIFAGRKGPGKKLQMEAFFADLPDDGRLILNLNASPELLEKIIKTGHRPIILPNGTTKFSIPPEFVKEVRRLTIGAITFLPPVRLDRKSFEAVHGPAEANIGTGDGNLHLLYPNLGLDFIRGEDGMDILQFVPLNRYEELVAPLKKAMAELEAKGQMKNQGERGQ
jgi:hypothetical protein